ncbi:MAG: hypothetical protein IBX60_06680 [Candidatus Aminicenantes bacterium]|nr:hypothetical protein [Candidatus Aminicenantes bacterium]
MISFEGPEKKYLLADLAQTPPMERNSWNKFGCKDAKQLKRPKGRSSINTARTALSLTGYVFSMYYLSIKQLRGHKLSKNE